MIKSVMSLVAVLFVASNALAISDETLAMVCFQEGTEKIVSQAQAWGCEAKANEVEVVDIDNRWYNPSKYIWFQVKTQCGDKDQINVMVQYYRGKCY